MTKLSNISELSLKLLPLVGALILSGCSTLAPEYARSEIDMVDTLDKTSELKGKGLTNQYANQVPWESFIQDKYLSQVIQLALNSNRTLRQTLADVEMARATYRIQKADLYPQVDLGLSGNRSKVSTGSIDTSYQAQAGLTNYEIDLFGKNRSLTTVQMEAYLASEETAKAARISLIGEITSAWLTLAADKNQLRLAQETAVNAEKTLEIINKRLSLGVDSKADVASAETIYHSARSDIANFTTQVAQDLNALQLLVGEKIDTNLLPEGLPSSQDLLSDVPAGLSSALLLQRPDVLSAEHALKSANANIGVARAAYLPSLSLTATGGLASNVLADIFSGGASSIWSIAPSLTLPIFDGGANDANLAYSKAQQTKYLAAYEYAIQNAFSEVADALARRATIQAQLNAEQALVAAATQRYNIALARYKGGIDDFQNALEAQRTMYQAKQSFIVTQQADLNNRISLYRVLGGGLAKDNVSKVDG